MSIAARFPAWRRLTPLLAAGVFIVTLLHAHAWSLYAIARIPIVRLRLLDDHTAAAWPALGAFGCMAAAFAIERRGVPSRAQLRIVQMALLGCALAMLPWFFRFGWHEWGTGPDWDKDWVYFQASASAIRSGQLPYYVRMLQQGTERYLANLETPLTPDLILLAFIPAGAAFLIHLGACIAAGYAGAVRLRRQLDLSLFWWSVWVVLFLLNGHVLSHLGTGHTQWTGYFLLPWVFVAMLKLDTPRTSRDAIVLAMTLAAMIALGSWHVFVWSFIVCLAFTLFRPSGALFMLKVSALVAALAAYRLVPALLTFGVGNNVFAGSYESIAHLVAGLTGGAMPAHTLGAHEFDLFVGWCGFAILCMAIAPRFAQDRRGLTAFWLASATMVLLSLFNVYESTLFKLPGFVSERVASRIAVVGVAGLLLIACARLSQLAPPRLARSPATIGIAVTLMAWMAIELGLHADSLRPAAQAPDATVEWLKTMTVEPAYRWSIWGGAAISTIALAGVVRSLLRRHDDHTQRRSA